MTILITCLCGLTVYRTWFDTLTVIIFSTYVGTASEKISFGYAVKPKIIISYWYFGESFF